MYSKVKENKENPSPKIQSDPCRVQGWFTEITVDNKIIQFCDCYIHTQTEISLM